LSRMSLSRPGCCLLALLVLVAVLAYAALLSTASSDAGGRILIEKDVVGNTTWRSGTGPYRIVRSITIEGKLVIEPGVVVEIAGGSVLTIKGELIVHGNSTAPVVIKSLGGAWRLQVLGGVVHASHVVLRGVLELRAIRGDVVLEKFNATGVVLGPPYSGHRPGAPLVNSSILFGDGWLGFLSYWGIDSPVAANTLIILRNTSTLCICPWNPSRGKPSYVLGKTGAYYPPPLSERLFLYNSSLRVIGSCILLGADLRSSTLSNIAFYDSAIREILATRIRSSNLTILGSEIAWGRGIYIMTLEKLPKAPGPRLVVHNTSIHDAIISWADTGIAWKPVGVRVELLAGLVAEPESVMDLRYNWWGDPTGPYHKQLNPEGRGVEIQARARIYPWLREPPRKPLVLSINVEPPMPMQGIPFRVRVSGNTTGPYLYLFGYGTGLFNSVASIVLGGPVATHLYNYTSIGTTMKVPLIVTACRGGRSLAGGFRVIEVLPSPRLLGEGTSIDIYSPTASIVSPSSGTVTFNASITVLDKEVTNRLRNWVKALLLINNTAREMKRDGDFYTYSAELRDGIYYWSIVVEYAGIKIAKTPTRRLVVDTSPPSLVKARLNTTTGVLRVLISDKLSGIKRLVVIAETSAGAKIVSQKWFPRGTPKEEYEVAIPPRVLDTLKDIRIVLEDWAGNNASYTVKTTPWVKTTTTKEIPVRTTQSITTAPPRTNTPGTKTVRKPVAQTASREQTTQSQQAPRETNALNCIYNPLTISLLAITISILAIIVVATRQRPSTPSHASQP